MRDLDKCLEFQRWVTEPACGWTLACAECTKEARMTLGMPQGSGPGRGNGPALICRVLGARAGVRQACCPGRSSCWLGRHLWSTSRGPGALLGAAGKVAASTPVLQTRSIFEPGTLMPVGKTRQGFRCAGRQIGPAGVGVAGKAGSVKSHGIAEAPSPSFGEHPAGPPEAGKLSMCLQRQENSSCCQHAGPGWPPSVLEQGCWGGHPMTWSGPVQIYSSGRHSVRITGISNIDFRAGFSTQPSLDLNHTIEWPLQGIVLLALGHMELPSEELGPALGRRSGALGQAVRV